MNKVPTEPQLEAAFEVLAWLERRFEDESRFDGERFMSSALRYDVRKIRDLLRREVDRCLDE